MERTCRFCYNSDSSIFSELISPCQCTTFVHRSCLDKWRCASHNPDSLTECDACLTPYQIERPVTKQTKYLAKIFFSFLIFRDVTLMLIILVGSFAISGYLATKAVGGVSTDDITTSLLTILIGIILSGVTLFLLFLLYLIVSYLITPSRKNYILTTHPNYIQYKPYWLDLMLDTNGNVHCLICTTYPKSEPHDDEETRSARVIACFACCLCLMAIEFIHMLVKIIMLHIRNLYKNSHCKVYRVKNLENIIQV